MNDSIADFYVWEWEDEHGHWNPYDTNSTLLLELGRGKKEKTVEIHVEAFDRDYTIDLKNMVQTNNDTGVKRNVRRQKLSKYRK